MRVKLDVIIIMALEFGLIKKGRKDTGEMWEVKSDRISRLKSQ